MSCLVEQSTGAPYSLPLRIQIGTFLTVPLPSLPSGVRAEAKAVPGCDGVP